MWDLFCVFLFFFFKQKTAYEMRISDWSSDVCSSDLRQLRTRRGGDAREQDHPVPEGEAGERDDAADLAAAEPRGAIDAVARRPAGEQRESQIVAEQIGRASCRERGCQYV